MCTGQLNRWVTGVCWLAIAAHASAQDWPQWRGPNRDAKASGFNAPQNWPAELSQKWKVTVGSGVSTPAVVGDRVFVFARQDDQEVLRCLNAETGDEVWQAKYPAEALRGGGDSGYSGPRSSPTVAEGKVVTFGVHGVLCCFDAATGKELWRNDDLENEVPMFHTSSSPIVVNGLCVAQLGGRDNGGIYAFDLASGEERWKWTEDGPAYGSPVLMTIDNTQAVVAPTSQNLVALSTDGKVLWEIPYEQGGRYTSATPIVHGDVLIVAGPGSGVSAFRLKKDGDKIVEEKLWSNTDNSLVFNTPVLKGNLLVGLSNAGQLFCINIENGEETAWTAPITRAAQGAAGEAGARGAENNRTDRVRAIYVQAAQQEDRQQQDRGDRPGARERRQRGEGQREGRGGFGSGRGRRGGRGGGGGGGGYGSIVDAGSVLVALSPAGELVVFKPSDEAYSEVARYKVAEPLAGRSDEGTFAYPVAVGDAIYIKDRDTLTRWEMK
jgi:outer membrane protein assembly factor BamB